MSRAKHEVGKICVSPRFESVESVLRLPDGSVLTGAEGGVYVVRGQALAQRRAEPTLGSAVVPFVDGLVLASPAAVASVLPLVVRHVPDAPE